MRVGRRFQLHRDTDVSGVSGEGIVADGIEYPEPYTFTFPDGATCELPAGWASLRWRGKYRSTVLWDSAASAEAVHGHHGSTRLVWLDPEQIPDSGGYISPGLTVVVNTTGQNDYLLPPA